MSTMKAAEDIRNNLIPSFQMMNSSIGMAVSNFQELNMASSNALRTITVEAGGQELFKIKEEVSKIENSFHQMGSAAAHAQKQVMGVAEQAGAGVEQAAETLEKSTAKTLKDNNTGVIKIDAQMLLSGAEKLVALSDQFSQIKGKVKAMNDGLQTTDELQEMIFASAQRTRTPYMEIADTISQISQVSGDAFQSNAETIAFAENANKLYAMSGAAPEEAASGSVQLAEMAGSEAISGGDFEQIYSTAPGVIETIADYMDMPIEKVRAMGEEGKISGDTLKNALLASTDEINGSFEEMPFTWGQIWTGILNEILMLAQPILDFISLLAQNWQILEPIMMGLAAAIGVFLLAVNAATWAMQAWGVVQNVFNAIMAMNPIFIIIMAVMLLIGVIFGVVAAINQFAGTSFSALGVIAGIFGAVFAFIWNVVAKFVNFFANAWTDPIGTIVRLFAALGDKVLETLEVIASGIDKVFKTDYAKSISGWRQKLQVSVEEKFGKASEFMKEKDVKKTAKDAYDWGEEKQESFKRPEGLGSITDNPYQGENPADSLANQMEGLNKNTLDTAENSARMADTMEGSNESLQYMRDLAEQESINQFTTAQVKVDFGGVVNKISNNMDLDGVVDYLAEKTQEALQISAEGVYA